MIGWIVRFLIFGLLRRFLGFWPMTIILGLFALYAGGKVGLLRLLF